MEHIDFPPHHGSPRYTPCACRLPTWISLWPLMRDSTNHSHRTTGQKSRWWYANWSSIVRFFKSVWRGPSQASSNEVGTLWNSWEPSQMDRIVASRKSQSVVVHGTCSSQVMVKSGVPQGIVLGPLMFLLYINDIGNEINSNLRLFADDSILHGMVNNFQDVQALQADLNKLVEWAQKWQMTLNSSKCVMLRVSRSVNDVNFSYEMMGRPPESDKSKKYLGVEINRTVSWNKHISAITGKGNRALGFIRRNLHNCPEEVKKQVYYSLVRPHLEYASSAWDPHTQKNIKSIEGVQCRAARFVKCCYQRELGTVTKLLKDLA